MTVRELSELLGVTAIDIIKDLMKTGIMAAINQTIDFETASKVAVDMGFEVEPLQEAAIAPDEEEEKEDPAKLKSRPPVVPVMGPADHDTHRDKGLFARQSPVSKAQ